MKRRADDTGRQEVSKRIGFLLTFLGLACTLAWAGGALAQPAGGAPRLPADPWPREVTLPDATLLIYQPQVSSWQGNTLALRAAVAVRPTGGKQETQETFGVVWATARTQVDRVSRIVALHDFTVTKSDFPTLPDRGAAYLSALQTHFAASQRTIALDRLEASLAASGAAKPTEIAVNNDPPRIMISETPALLVPIDGAPVVRPVPGTIFERVINTRALVIREQGTSTWYLHVYDGWLSAAAVAGPWVETTVVPPALGPVAQQLARSGQVDLLDGGNTKPKPSLSAGVPTIYVSETPTELLVFRGQPSYTSVPGTSLDWVSNTSADVLYDTAGRNYYILAAGRWYRAALLTGPWSFVASTALPPDFRRIPRTAPAGVVLAAVAGTPEAQEAVIANSIPQTATIPRVNGPAFSPVFDGAPQFRRIEGTPLQYVVNSPTPIIQVSPSGFYALRAGVWFSATALGGPWYVAAYVPAAVYTIPPTSPLHYVTYVQVYGSTAQVVYVGYTPGYLGTVVAPGGVVVYGTGYAYQPLDRDRLVPAARHVWRRRAARVQPGGRDGVRLCHGGHDGRADGRLLSPRLLQRLPVLRLDERQRLRPLRQRELVGDPVVLLELVQRRPDRQRQLHELSNRHDGDVLGQSERRSVGGDGDAGLFADVQHAGRGQRRGRSQRDV